MSWGVIDEHVSSASSNIDSFFGFSEFLGALALMVLAWTLSGFRYHFRIQTSAFPLRNFTFISVLLIGVCSLVIELLRVTELGLSIDYRLLYFWFEFGFASLFLLVFLTWAWTAFISPPRLGIRNYKKFLKATESVVLRGAPAELSILADELRRSITQIAEICDDRLTKKSSGPADIKSGRKAYRDAEAAWRLIQLLSVQRFVRLVVDQAPAFLEDFFDTVAHRSANHLPLNRFYQNVLISAIENSDSFLHHEIGTPDGGFMEEARPVTGPMFSNGLLIARIRFPFSLNSRTRPSWNGRQWRAYFRALSTACSSVLKSSPASLSSDLIGAGSEFELLWVDLVRIDGKEERYDLAEVQKFEAAIECLERIIDALDENDLSAGIPLRRRDNSDDVFESVAKAYLNAFSAAGKVRSPFGLCWSLQYGMLWKRSFGATDPPSKSRKIVLFRLRRLIFEELERMAETPNYVGASVLAVCLNILGLRENVRKRSGHIEPLRKVVHVFVHRHFHRIYQEYPELRPAILVGNMSYEPESRELKKKYRRTLWGQQAETLTISNEQ